MAFAREYESQNEFGGRSSQAGSPSITGVPMQTTPLPTTFSRPGSRPRGGFAPGAPAPGSFPNVGGVPTPPPPPGAPAPTPQPTPQPAQRTERVSGLMEGEAHKLNDQGHIAKSPKDQFLSMAPYYGRGEESQLLSDLQSKYADYWQGWTWDGKGNFRYGGDPSKLHSAWNGVSFVDAYGGYNAGGPLQARWGADDQGQMSGTSDPTVNALLQAFSVPGMQAPAPSIDMNAILSLFTAMQAQPQATPQPINLTLPEPEQAPAPTFYGDVSPSVLNFGGDGISEALTLMAQRAPYLMRQPETAEDGLLAAIRQLVGGA
jgi:hypothetical protein